MSFKRSDYIAFGTIFGYCLLYMAMRFAQGSTLGGDEALQFVNSLHFHLGFENQPPLYNWIINLLFKIFGEFAELIILFRFLLFFIFYSSVYLLAKNFFKSKIAFLCTGSLMILPIYSYNLITKYTHTLIAACIAAITCLVYFQLIKDPTRNNYIYLGICFGFGLLAKYNFAFLIFALVLASLATKFGRGIILSKQSNIAILAMLLVLTPHLIWQIQEGFPTFAHALSRGHSGELDSFNIFALIWSMLRYLFQPLIYLSLFTAILYPAIEAKLKHDDPSITTLRILGLLVIGLPSMAIILLKLGKFHVAWLLPFIFLLPIAAFSLVDFKKLQAQRHKFYMATCIGFAAVTIIAHSIMNFMPDLTNKVLEVQTPFRSIAKQIGAKLQERNIQIKDRNLIIIGNRVLKNIRAQLPKMSDVYSFEEFQNNEDLKQQSALIIWNANIKNIATINMILEASPEASFLPAFKENFYYSSKHKPYALGLAIIN